MALGYLTVSAGLAVCYNPAAVDKKVLVLFLDGIGLGEDNSTWNPFCAAEMPTLNGLLGEGWYLNGGGPRYGPEATMVPTDALLGVSGRPQSATGQASLLTGSNVAAAIGEHFGPKPNAPIRAILKTGNLFSWVQEAGGSASYVNPFPPRFFQAIESGRRLLSAIPLAACQAGLKLKTHEDLLAGTAVSPDFTGQGWRDRLGFSDMPILSLEEAGERLGRLADSRNLMLFEHWPTDLYGHRRDFQGAVGALERFDRFLSGLAGTWNSQEGLVLITSDHGNMENLEVKSHTLNLVPTIVIGKERHRVAERILDLTDVTPAILDYLRGGTAPDQPESGRPRAH